MVQQVEGAVQQQLDSHMQQLMQTLPDNSWTSTAAGFRCDADALRQALGKDAWDASVGGCPTSQGLLLQDPWTDHQQGGNCSQMPDHPSQHDSIGSGPSDQHQPCGDVRQPHAIHQIDRRELDRGKQQVRRRG